MVDVQGENWEVTADNVSFSRSMVTASHWSNIPRLTWHLSAVHLLLLIIRKYTNIVKLVYTSKSQYFFFNGDVTMKTQHMHARVVADDCRSWFFNL